MKVGEIIRNTDSYNSKWNLNGNGLCVGSVCAGRKVQAYYGNAYFRKRVVKPKAFYNHMLDVAFTIPMSPFEDWACNSNDTILDALQKRVNYLRANPNELIEAIGHCDTYEEPLTN